jgi:predicted membrane-bound spermidine synthase
MTELSLTRIFSVTMYYHFAFMAISIALFGLSASGVYVFLARQGFRAQDTERLLVRHALAYAVVTLAALAMIVRLRVGLHYTPGAIAVVCLMYVVSALPFFAGGAAVSIAITRFAANVNAVYAADLLGAAAGCLVLMPVLNRLGAPGAIVVSALCALAAALCWASPARSARAGSAAAAIAIVAAAAGWLGAFSVSTTKGHEHDQVLFSKWNSFSRIGVYDTASTAWSLSDRYAGPLPDVRLMDIDSAAATQIIRFGGDLQDVSYLQYELTALGYRLFGRVGAPPATPFTALVIGTGGGRDLLSALVFGAAHVDGVEINPIIVNDVMRGRFRDYSGRVYDRPDVDITVEDGRSFVRRSPKRYDVIQASLVDTWAATSAGAYALTENSLYTVEAFDDYLDHLTDRGVLSISRWVFDGLRLVSLAQDAGERRGWRTPDHVAIIQQDKVATFLFKKTAFTPAETDLLARTAADLHFSVIYLPGHPVAAFGDTRDDYTRLLLAPDRQAFYRDFPFDVAPTTDDRPFFFNTTRLGHHWMVARVMRLFGRDVASPELPGSWGTGGLTAILILLGVSTALIVVFVLGPLALTSREALGQGWGRVLAYFACLGCAFMLIEVALLQRFVLLLGHPVYSLTVTLFSLLVGTGLGSMASRRTADASLRRTAAIACLGVMAIALVWGDALPFVVRAAVGWPLPWRILLAAGLMVPAGLAMGIPLPAGVRVIAAGQPDLVPWAWGINGALSVLGATLAVFLAMNWGFTVTLICGAAVYACAAALISRR